MGLEKRDLHFLLALGADYPVSNGDDSLSPILYTSLIFYHDKVSMFTDLGATTTTVFFDAGYQKDKILAGFKPFFNHSVYSAYQAYWNGKNYNRITFKGQYTGMELYCKYNWISFDVSPEQKAVFSTKLTYTPAYYFYWKYKASNFLDGFSTYRSFTLPNDHWENTARLDVALSSAKDIDDLGIVKHGFVVSATYMYTLRTGYGRFFDQYRSSITGNTGQDVSDESNAHRVYMKLGGYYRLPMDFNLKAELFGCWSEGLDRNNADQIGSFMADDFSMPGFYVTEFNHDKYMIGRFNVVLPAPAWEIKFEPGFNLLYMNKENGVVGALNYKRQVYMSASLGVTMKLGNLVPFVLKYAYGINADRKGEIGNHEIVGIVIAGFFDVDKDGKGDKKG